MVRLEVTQESHTFTSTEFQFQYGAIGSKYKEWKELQLSNFNSSMVRLEVLIQTKSANGLIYFNSSMVRLEEGGNKRCYIVPKFQFQYGAIGRGYKQSLNYAKKYFNSSMVRLEAVDFAVSGYIVNLFQFQYGAIGST